MQPEEVCKTCGGDGWLYESLSDPEAKRVRCEDCDGAGTIEVNPKDLEGSEVTFRGVVGYLTFDEGRLLFGEDLIPVTLEEIERCES